MRLILLFLSLAQPAWSRHVFENNIVSEIAQTTDATVRIDGEMRSGSVSDDRRAALQADRAVQVEKISTLAASHPESPVINVAAAESLMRVHEPLRAEAAAGRAVVAAPGNADPLILRARARAELGRYEEAAGDYRKALRLRPGDPAAIVGLKLTEGRATSRERAILAPPTQPTTATPSSPPATRPLPDADRIGADKARLQRESLEHYNASLIAKSAGDWPRALESAEKALSLAPDSDFFKRHKASVLEERAAATAPKAEVPKAIGDDAIPIGPASFIGGLLHYTGKSARNRRIDFHDVDTSDVKVADFSHVKNELRKPKRNAVVKIESRKGWKSRGRQWLLIGRVTLLLKGELVLHEDCRWSFSGSLRAFDDHYDFNEDKRGFIGESLTAIGRALPGKEYNLEVRGVKPILESGVKEPCQ